MYKLLIIYSNERLGIIKIEELASLFGVEYFAKMSEIRDALWKNEDCYDKFVEEFGDRLSHRESIILIYMFLRVERFFVLAEHCRDYSLFIHVDTGKKYGVIGISEPFDKIIPASMLPVYATTVLLPFEGKIINDGYMDIGIPKDEEGRQEIIAITNEAMKNQEVITNLTAYAWHEILTSFKEDYSEDGDDYESDLE